MISTATSKASADISRRRHQTSRAWATAACRSGRPTAPARFAGRPLDGHSLKPFLLDPNIEKWDGPDAALTTLFRWAKTYNPSEQSYTLRSKDWRYIRYSNGKEELYDHVNDPHEWTNLAGNPETAARLEIFRQQLAQRLPDPADNPVPPKTDAEAWKDKFFKQHPEADANKDGVLSWPEYKAHKAKLDVGKKGRHR